MTFYADSDASNVEGVDGGRCLASGLPIRTHATANIRGGSR